MARGAIAKKGAGGVIETLGKKAIRGYLKEATEGRSVKKVPSSKLDKARYDENRAYLKGSGLKDKELDEAVEEDLAIGGMGERNPEAHGISRSQSDELDDLNAKNEALRKLKQETKPVPTGGKSPPEVDFPPMKKGQKWKGLRDYKRGGRAKPRHEEMAVSGGKPKRRMDRKARR